MLGDISSLGSERRRIWRQMLVLLGWLAEEEAHDTRTRNYTNVLELVQFVHCLLLQWPGRNSTVEIHTVSLQN